MNSILALILGFSTIFITTNAASHAEGDSMTDGIRSLVGRHQLESMEHLYWFYAHDFFAFTSLLLFAILWNMSKSNPYHKWIGRFLAFPLIGAIVTGFKLIAFRTSDEFVHIHAIQLGRMTISTQGYCVIGICLNAFIYLRWVKEEWMNKALLLIHAFNVYKGIRSFNFLLTTYMQWNNSYDTNEVNREVAFELLFALTIPQLIVDGSYFCLHLALSIRPELVRNISWVDFHEMSVLGLIYICAIGVAFNVAHDAYYIFPSPGITDLTTRMMIIMAPFCYNLIVYKEKIWKSLSKLIFLVYQSIFDSITSMNSDVDLKSMSIPPVVNGSEENSSSSDCPTLLRNEKDNSSSTFTTTSTDINNHVPINIVIHAAD